MKNSFVSFLIFLFPIAAFADGEQLDTLRLHEIDEVVVNAQQLNQSLLPSLGSTVSIGRAELMRAGTSQTLSALQGSVPSFFISSRSVLGFGLSTGGAGSIKIRGVGGDTSNGIVLAVDGLPQQSGIYGHPAADLYGMEQVECIEVNRGASSLRYGSGAMGGAVNIVTLLPKTDGHRTTLRTQYGSFNTSQTSASHQLRHGRFSLAATAAYDHTDGSIPGLKFQQARFWTKAAFELSRHWKMAADVSLSKYLADDPVYPRAFAGDSSAVYHQNVVRNSATLSATNSYGRTSGHVQAYYSWGNHFISDPRPFHSTDHRFGLQAAQQFALWQSASGEAGFSLTNYGGRIPLSGGKSYAEAPKGTLRHKLWTECAPYVALQQTLLNGRLKMGGGLRMAWSNAFGTHWLPQASASYALAETWLLSATAGRAYRNPSFKELFLYATANDDLQPETLASYELSLAKTFSQWLRLELTGYYINGREMISVQEGRYANTGRFENSGIELSAKSKPTQWLSIHANYSFLHTTLSNLIAAPRHQYFLETHFTPNPKWQAAMKLRGATDLFIGPNLPLKDFATLSLYASYQPTRILRLHLNLDNLTNTRYTIQQAYPMLGFTICGGVSVSL